ncbi:hypothetical protein [Moheibacter sediminis]|uniref:Uncharacterized protein n=1 Tax=Moheibacter sediminis TaxID=1434700 RepID=A0A1W2C7Z5_9FLAO|nr:hypothetical protein [Moheibacter sediminis]SMC81226.1 hypothetical protein SAMN06296427_10941 [Moheibacter sediminis]
MKTIFIIPILFATLSFGQSKMERTFLYENLIDFTCAGNNLEAYTEPPYHNGLERGDYSDDGNYFTTQYKLIDQDKLMVINNLKYKAIEKIIFIITPDIKGNIISTETIQFILNHLNKKANIITSNQAWKDGKMLILFEMKNDLGVLTISIY